MRSSDKGERRRRLLSLVLRPWSWCDEISMRQMYDLRKECDICWKIDEG